MFPILKPGEEVLVDTRAYCHCLPEIGDMVVAEHPHRQDLRIIKWVSFVDEKGDCFLVGDFDPTTILTWLLSPETGTGGLD